MMQRLVSGHRVRNLLHESSCLHHGEIVVNLDQCLSGSICRGARSRMLEQAGGGAGLRKEAFARLAAGESARQIFEGGGEAEPGQS